MCADVPAPRTGLAQQAPPGTDPVIPSETSSSAREEALGHRAPSARVISGAVAAIDLLVPSLSDIDGRKLKLPKGLGSAFLTLKQGCSLGRPLIYQFCLKVFNLNGGGKRKKKPSTF